MDPSVTIGLVTLIAVAAAAGVGLLAVRAVRDRYRHLLAAVADVARQVGELRRAVDRTHERVQTGDDRLAVLEPQVARLGRALEIERASERVRAAEFTGRLAPEAARALLRNLADLADDDAASPTNSG